MHRTALRALVLLAAVACGGSKSHTGVTQAEPPPPADDGGTTTVTPPPDTDGGTATPPPGSDGGAGAVSPPAAPSLGGVSAGATVAAQVPLTASVPAGTARVDFLLDGATLATSAAAPFTAVWDTFGAANGAHTLSINAIDGSGAATPSASVGVTVANHINHVFVIVMENHDWSSIKGNSAAPYINDTLLKQGAHAEQYLNVPNLHPSLPNYIWLEAGTNFGITDDSEPPQHPLTSKQHLVTLLENAGVTWKAYQEDIDGSNCPIAYVNDYAPKHDPMVYFTDVNGSSRCVQHIRPYGELAADLEADTVPQYSFITPNLCNDMHDCSVGTGDSWLAREVPHILASKAYREGGALFITWDESEGGNVPIGFMVMSPLAKPGYSNTVSYTHSSTLRSIEEIFGVTPLLGGAATATALADLFKSFP